MDTSKIEYGLEQIGLTKSEIKVYLALLKLGASSTGKIVAESRTANSKIYEVLDKLVDKGLASYFEEGSTRKYKATSPKQISRYLTEKKEEISKQEKEIEALIPTLLTLSQEKEDEKQATVLRGPKGVKAGFEDIMDTLKRGEEVRVMGVYQFGEEYLRLAHYFQKIRFASGVKGKFLINKSARTVADMISKYPPAEIRFMQEGVVTPALFIIYANKVIISLGDEFVFFVITSKRSAEVFNIFFDQIWDKAELYKKV